jgi:hypothetical protein
MPSFTETLRDKWESITPRERRLVVLLGIVAPIVLVIFLGFQIMDGLEMREKRNDRMRQALRVLDGVRAKGEQAKPADDVVALMTSEPLDLDSYVDNVAKKVPGVTIPRVGRKTPVNKDGFVHSAVNFEVRDVNVNQAKDFLEALETDSKLVAVTSLTITRKFRDEEKDKLDLKIDLATWSLEKKEGEGDGKGSGSAAGTADAKKGTP